MFTTFWSLPIQNKTRHDPAGPITLFDHRFYSYLDEFDFTLPWWCSLLNRSKSKNQVMGFSQLQDEVTTNLQLFHTPYFTDSRHKMVRRVSNALVLISDFFHNFSLVFLSDFFLFSLIFSEISTVFTAGYERPEGEKKVFYIIRGCFSWGFT